MPQHTNHTPQEPIAIVGSGCRFPGASNTPSKLWSLLCDPTDVRTPIPADRFSSAGFHHADGTYHGHSNVQHGHFLSGGAVPGFHRRFDARFFGINPSEAHAMDPQMRLLLETVYEALEAGGHTIEALAGSDTAVYAGNSKHLFRSILTQSLPRQCRGRVMRLSLHNGFSSGVIG